MATQAFLSELQALVQGTGAKAPKKVGGKTVYTKDGVEYKLDRWTRKYAPVDTFVNGKDYTKESYQRWTFMGARAKDIAFEIVDALASGTKASELKDKIEFVNYLRDARNSDPEAYADIASNYLSQEDFLS